jgi:hypothetical protein
MSYPATYDGDDPPPIHIYANNDSDDEDDCVGVGYNDSDDEADCGGVGYNGDGVDMKIPAKRDGCSHQYHEKHGIQIIQLGMRSPFNTTPRAEEKTFVTKLAGLW